MTFPARLHVLLARAAPVGLVIRRGPSKEVCVIGWDRECDEFHLGQWMKGRIYERRCDLSPDGRHFIYFAMNGSRTRESTGGAWTAVSRAPYLKALTLLGKGDCWHGGGLFTANEVYWLNNGYGHEILLDSTEVRRDPVERQDLGPGGECLGVYYPRLLRDGWRHCAPDEAGESTDPKVFEKDLSAGWTLRKVTHRQSQPPMGKSPYWDAHELRHAGAGTCVARPNWEWAEWDRCRLVWAVGGQLWAGEMTSEGLRAERVLHDFNEMLFEAIAAPY